MSQYEEGTFTPEAYIQMLQMQVEELESKLMQEIALHKKANNRATMAEKRCQKLKSKTDNMERDFRILAECWCCSDLGNKDRCAKCTNSVVFVWNGAGYEWRGLNRK